MSRSPPAMGESCTRSGGRSDNGAWRGRGIARKWMDGRTVKEDTVGRGTSSVVPWVSCGTDTSDEVSNSISSCTRDEDASGGS